MRTKILALGLVCFFTLSCASFELGNLNPKKRRAEYIAAHPELDEKIEWLISKGHIYLGMTCDEVVASIGKPYKINRSVGSYGVHEQWVMCAPNSYRDRRFGYVYFENGIVTSWQSR